MVGVPLLIGRGADPICWPFFEDCAAWQLPVGVVNDGLWGYLLIPIVTAVCFLRGRIRLDMRCWCSSTSFVSW